DDGGRDFVARDHPAEGLAAPKRFERGVRIGLRGHGAFDPRTRDGAGRDAVDADAVRELVDRHRTRESQHGTLRRQYTARSTRPTDATTEHVLTTTPRPAARITGRTARDMLATP